MKRRSVDFVNKTHSENEQIGQGQEIDMAKNPKLVKAYGNEMGQTFGTFDSNKNKIEIYELSKKNGGPTNYASSNTKNTSTNYNTNSKGGMRKRNEVIGSNTKENEHPSMYKKTHEFYVESPVKQSYASEQQSRINYNTFSTADQQNEVIRRRNEVEDYYESLRKRTDVDYNNSVNAVRNNMRGLPGNEYLTNRNSQQYQSSDGNFMSYRNSQQFPSNNDYMNS